MIQVICPKCSAVVFVLILPDEGESVECPHCREVFVPDEEEWVDSEDM